MIVPVFRILFRITGVILLSLMSRKKILWLCSWYPGRNEPFSGDFIQRHARAAALFNDIHVIHLAGDTSGKIKDKESVIQTDGGLTEHLIYFAVKKTFIGRILTHYRWLFLCKQAIRNYIIKNGKPDLVHVHVPMKAGIPAIWLKKRYKVPFVVTEHWGIYNSVVTDRFEKRSRLFRRYTKKIFTNASRFISVSKFLGDGVNRLVVKKEYTVIPNAADTQLFFPAGNKSPVFRFIHVSNMVPLKNAEGILRAFAVLQQKNSNTELVMVGDTDPAIRTFAGSLNIPQGKIIFKGEVSYAQVADEMQKANCLVLFSNIENSPCVIGEALCCGLPVIATSVGGIPELVDTNNSLLVNPGDETALANAMDTIMITSNRYDAERIAANAASRFSYTSVGKQFDQVYSDLITPSPKAGN